MVPGSNGRVFALVTGVNVLKDDFQLDVDYNGLRSLSPPGKLPVTGHREGMFSVPMKIGKPMISRRT
jgi:hypothetical protein